MQSFQTFCTFSLSKVKPLKEIEAYRRFCLDAVQSSLKNASTKRSLSPVTGKPLQFAGEIEGLAYGRCEESGSLFLSLLPTENDWQEVLKKTTEFRLTKTFQKAVTEARYVNVLQPKLEWIENRIRMEEMKKPSLIEVTLLPSPMLPLFKESSLFGSAMAVSEETPFPQADVFLFPETLDRSLDPRRLLSRAVESLRPGGLLFLTSLVSSGFDFSLLGFHNAYLYPPDRANVFSIGGLENMVSDFGLHLLEVSTPGVLDAQIVNAHRSAGVSFPISDFERTILDGDEETLRHFQSFLQQSGLSSFARIVGRKNR